MAIYYEIGNLETKLSKSSIFIEICRKKNQAKMCTPKLEGKWGKLVYLLEENQNGFFSKSFWPIIV